MVIVGIDPGKSGGFASLKNGKLVNTMSMKKIGNEIDINSIYHFLSDTDHDHGIDMVVLEHSQAIFGVGAKQTFEFGRSIGILEGVLGVLKLPLIKVKPKVWQKVSWQGVTVIKNNGKTNTKKMSLVAVNRLFPNAGKLLLATDRSRVPHDGIVDAILMGYYYNRV